jgi:hypothetical protein
VLAWPLVGLPFSTAHNPQRKELRRQERAAGDAQFERVRAHVRTASAEVLGRVLERLLLEHKVKAADIEARSGRIRR